MRAGLLFLIGLAWCGPLKAQHQDIFNQYCQEAGDHAELYVGKIERGYPATIYLNHPYWLFEDFIPGEVVYKGLLYNNVRLRYDAYMKQLVVKTPDKRSNIYIPMSWVEKFTMGGTDFVRRNGEFVAQLVNTSRVELIEQVHYDLKEEMVDNMKSCYNFRRKVKYFLTYEGQTYEVDKLKSVLKPFRGNVKREMRSFAKQHLLNFREYRQSSLITLIKYADELLAQP